MDHWTAVRLAWRWAERMVASKVPKMAVQMGLERVEQRVVLMGYCLAG